MNRFPRLSASAALSACLLFWFYSSGCRKDSAAKFADRPQLTAAVTLRDVTFHSSALGREMTYRAIFPTSPGPGKKLQVVYLLHGGGGGFRDWSNYSDVGRYADRGMLLVMPEGDSSYYVNSAEQPKERYEDYIVQDLIADVEGRFPVGKGRQNRAIAGVSMGGYGAINLAMKHPNLFGFAAGISPAIDVPSRPFSIRRLEQWRRFQSIFGEYGSNTRQENDPFLVVRKSDPAIAPYFYLTCGAKEGLMASNKQLASLLSQRDFHYEFHEVPGDHNWKQWRAQVPNLFQKIITILNL